MARVLSDADVGLMSDADVGINQKPMSDADVGLLSDEQIGLAPQKREVGMLQAAWDDLNRAGSNIGRTVAAVAGIPALALDRGLAAVGAPETGAAEWWAKNAVAPYDEQVKAYDAKRQATTRGLPAEMTGMAGQVVADAPLMMSGGPLQAGLKTAAGPITNLLSRAFTAAQPLATKTGVDAYVSAKERGMDDLTAAKSGLAGYQMMSAMGMGPMGVNGNMAQKVASGAAAGPVVSAGSRAYENLVNADQPQMQQPVLDPTQALKDAIFFGVMHGVMGGKAEPKQNTEAARQTYVDAANAEAAAAKQAELEGLWKQYEPIIKANGINDVNDPRVQILVNAMRGKMERDAAAKAQMSPDEAALNQSQTPPDVIPVDAQGRADAGNTGVKAGVMSAAGTKVASEKQAQQAFDLAARRQSQADADLFNRGQIDPDYQGGGAAARGGVADQGMRRIFLMDGEIPVQLGEINGDKVTVHYEVRDPATDGFMPVKQVIDLNRVSEKNIPANQRAAQDYLERSKASVQGIPDGYGADTLAGEKMPRRSTDRISGDQVGGKGEAVNPTDKDIGSATVESQPRLSAPPAQEAPRQGRTMEGESYTVDENAPRIGTPRLRIEDRSQGTALPSPDHPVPGRMMITADGVRPAKYSENPTPRGVDDWQAYRKEGGRTTHSVPEQVTPPVREFRGDQNGIPPKQEVPPAEGNRPAGEQPRVESGNDGRGGSPAPENVAPSGNKEGAGTVQTKGSEAVRTLSADIKSTNQKGNAWLLDGHNTVESAGRDLEANGWRKTGAKDEWTDGNASVWLRSQGKDASVIAQWKLNEPKKGESHAVQEGQKAAEKVAPPPEGFVKAGNDSISGGWKLYRPEKHDRSDNRVVIESPSGVRTEGTLGRGDGDLAGWLHKNKPSDAKGLPDELFKAKIDTSKQDVFRAHDGKLGVQGFSKDEVKAAAGKVEITMKQGENGRILVERKDGKPFTDREFKSIRTALMGKDVSTSTVKRVPTGNSLKRDMDIIAPGLYTEVVKGGDGEGGKRDMVEVAARLREIGYLLPEGMRAEDGVIDMIKRDWKGDRQKAVERVETDLDALAAEKHRDDVLSLAKEYGVSVKEGIANRKFEDIERDVEEAIRAEIPIAGESAASFRAEAIKRGVMSESEASAMEDKVYSDLFGGGDPKGEADSVKLYREIANAYQDRINEHEQRASENEGSIPTDGKAESRPDFSLESQSENDLRARADAEQRAKADEQRRSDEADRRASADRQVNDFTLTGSDRPADANPNQRDIFGNGPTEMHGFGSAIASGLKTALKDAWQHAPQPLKDLADKVYNDRFTDGLIPDKTIWDDMRRKVQDMFVYLDKTQKEVEKRTGQAIDDAKNVYQRMMLMHGRRGERIGEFENKYVKPIEQLVKQIHKNKGVSLEDIDQFLMARHAFERNAMVAKRNSYLPDAGSGISNSEAQKILDGLRGEGKYDALERLGKQTDEVAKWMRDQMLDYGLIDKETHSRLSQYKHYVPLKGEEFETVYGFGRGSGTGVGIDIPRNVARGATGRFDMAKDALANLLSDAEGVIVVGEKNRVNQALYDLVQSTPPNNLWRVGDKTTRAFIGKDGTVTYRQTSGANDQNVIRVRIDGVQHEIHFNKQAEHIYGPLRNIDTTQPIKHLTDVTRFMSAMATQFNPEFVITNAARDVQSAFINASADGHLTPKQAAAMTTGWAKSVAGIYRDLRSNGQATGEWSKWFKEFAENGGTTHFLERRETERTNKELEHLIKATDGNIWHKGKDAVGVIGKWVSDANSSVENATRLVYYRALRENGMSAEKAAAQAKEITVNFNKKGEMSPLLSSAYMFLNASVQGSARALKSGITSPVGRTIMGTLAVGGGINATINRLMSDEDEDGRLFYDKIPEGIKQRNMILMQPNGRDYFKVPLPYAFNVPYVIGKEMADIGEGKEPIEAAANIWKATIASFDPFGDDNILMQLLPSVLRPAFQARENVSWTGQKIHPVNTTYQGQPQKPNSQIATDRAMEGFKWMAEKMNSLSGGNSVRPGWADVFPETLEYLVRQYGGGPMSVAMAAIDGATEMMSTRETDVSRLPFIRKVLGKTSANPNQEYSDAVSNLGYMKQERDAGEDYDESLYSSMRYKAEQAHAADRAESDARKKIRNSQSLDADEKRELLDMLKETSGSRMKKFLSDYYDAGGKPQGWQNWRE